MKRLPLPSVDFSTALTAAISGIGDPVSRNLHTVELADAAAIEANYATCATSATLFAKPRVTTGDPLVHGALRKSDLTKLYTQYFVPETKNARQIYNDIKVVAGGKCPLCGGIGHVRTLDHYLPKANFPLYSVLPANLLPCCRDCNSEKLNSFAATQAEQTLHPYFDEEQFFAEKWIFARVIPTSPPLLEYFVAPPAGWSEDDKSRVRSHFVEYDLGGKFSLEAAADLSETIHTRRTTMAASTPEEFSDYLGEKGQTAALPINNWRRVMFAALAEDDWFCNQTFPDG